ncbi:acetyltransferase [Mycena leptocephala]|nr:acetyltransferase [Mycena leptocephala]
MREANLVTLRTHVPGDIGKIISRHGALYAEEFGWDITFESLVARIGADFIDNYDPAWSSGGFLGCVVLVKDKEVDAAKLRLLLVEPYARGMGVGKKLVGQCVDFAREAGYQRVVLWTPSMLVSARGIYKAAGFELVKAEEHDSFGVKLVGEFWELRFAKLV